MREGVMARSQRMPASANDLVALHCGVLDLKQEIIKELEKAIKCMNRHMGGIN